MTGARRRQIVGAAAAVLGAAACYALLAHPRLPADYTEAGRPPRLDPDYVACTVPPNIAPLNFVVKEQGRRYRVRVYGEDRQFVVASTSPEIVFPPRAWKRLLRRCQGGSMSFDVYVQSDDGAWQRFDAVSTRVAEEPVDPYVVYRRLKPVYNVYTNMGTYQRRLEDFDESPILLSGPDTKRCVNCHTFVGNDPQDMLVQMRGSPAAAMLMARNGAVTKTDTRTSLNVQPASYSAWHPGGRLVAFSVNYPTQVFHTTGDVRDVFDYAADLAIYDADSHRVHTTPQIADPDCLETFPEWSPDGKHLYFSRAPRLWPSDAKQKDYLPPNFTRVRYDLCRIAYDLQTDTWGKLETLLAAGDTGRSMSEAKVSPDGRLLLFCAHDYGAFPVYQPSSDLWMMDLDSRRSWRLDINSDRSDSWHSWSSNGRWIVFASKRRDGLFGRLYFSHVDPQGQTGKPFLMPQREPAMYDSCLENFNRPELVSGRVPVPHKRWQAAIEAEETQRAEYVTPAAQDWRADRDPGELRHLADLRTAVEKEPQQAALRWQLGRDLEAWGRVEEAVAEYRRAVELPAAGDKLRIEWLSHLAWLLATHPTDSVRNADQAMRLAERANEQVESESPPRLDVLAAAYAEAGLFRRAVEIAEQAQSLTQRTGDAAWATRLGVRLEFYRAAQPYRTPCAGGAGCQPASVPAGCQPAPRAAEGR